VTKSATDYETETQTIHDTKNNKSKLIKFVRNYDSGAGLSNCEHKKMSSYMVWSHVWQTVHMWHYCWQQNLLPLCVDRIIYWVISCLE